MNKKRRANILAGLLNNWEKAEQVRSKALNSSTEAEERQQDLLETSAGQIEKMTSNWQIFSQNVIDSDLVKNSLIGINTWLEKINETMEVESNFELNVDESKLSGSMNDFTKVFGRIASKFQQENLELWDSLKNMTQEELNSFGDELTPIANDYNILIAEMEQTTNKLEQARNMAKKASAGSDEERQQLELIKLYNNQLLNQKDRYTELTKEIGKYSVIGLEINEILDFIANNTYRLNEAQEENTDTTNAQLTAYDKAMNGMIDLTDSGTNQMLSDYKYFSNEKKRVIIDAFNAEISALSATISAYDAYMTAIEAPTKYLNKNKAFAIIGEEVNQFGSDFDIEGVKTNLNKLKSELSGLLDTGSGSSSSSSSSKEYEALSELEKQIMEIQHQSKLLDDELKRTDGYEEQISIINQLLSLKDKEIAKMEELVEDQKTEYMQYGEKTEEYEKGIEAYYKTVEAIGKLKNETYDYIETLESLGETQEEINSQSVENMRDDYTNMFDKLRDGYKDDADDFEKAQDKKIRAVERNIDRLRKKYDEEDFVDEEEEIQDKIFALEEERQMLSIDNSLQAQKRKFDINNELEVEQKSLAELQQERERELTIEGLEDKKDSYEEETRAYKEQLEERLDELDSFEEQVLNNLNGYKEDWAIAGGSIGDAFKGGLLPALEDINKEIAKTISSFNQITGQDIELPDVSGSTPNKGGETRYIDPSGNMQTGYIVDGQTKTASGDEVPVGSIVETAGGTYFKGSGGSAQLNGSFDDYIRHDGGIVGGQSFKNSGFMDYMSKMSSNEMPIIAERGEAVITESDIGNIAGATQTTAKFDSLIQVNNPQIGGNYNDIDDFSKQLATITSDQLAKLGIVNIGRN